MTILSRAITDIGNNLSRAASENINLQIDGDIRERLLYHVHRGLGAEANLNDLFSEYNETYEIMRASGHPQDVRE
jgi:hypothetical protein